MTGQDLALAEGTVVLPNLDIVQGWFDEAGVTHPADEICYNLGRVLQIAVNRANNAFYDAKHGREPWDGSGTPPSYLKDVSPAEIFSRLWGDLRAAANHLAYEIERFENMVPRHEWGAQENRGLSELDAALGLLGAQAVRLVLKPNSTRGHPRAPWHVAGHAICPTIQCALRSVGYSGRMAKTDQEGATAIIGAAAISWATGAAIQPEGFASAMRRRDRKKGTPKQRSPN